MTSRLCKTSCTLLFRYKPQLYIARSIHHGFPCNSIYTYSSSAVMKQKWRNTNNYHQGTFIGSLLAIPFLGYSYFNCNAEKIDIHISDYNTNFQTTFMDDKDINTNTQTSAIAPSSTNNHTFIKSAISANPAINPRKTIEHQLIQTPWIFRLALWFDNHKYYSCALWLYSIYIRNPRNEQYSYAVNNSAVIYYNRLKDYTKALSMYIKLGTDEIISRGREFQIAFCYDQKDPPDYDNAKHWYELCVKHRQARNESCVNALNNLFIICYNQKDWTKVLHYAEILGNEYINKKNWEFEVALAAYRTEEYAKAIAYWILYTKNASSKVGVIMNAYQNIGMIYRRKGLYKDALEWYLKIDEGQLIKRNQEGFIGLCYDSLGDTENAVRWFELMMENEDTKDTYNRPWVVKCCNVIGWYYNGIDEPEKAIEKGWSHMTDEEMMETGSDLHAWLSYVKVKDVGMQLKYLKMFMDREGDKRCHIWAEKFDTMNIRDNILLILGELKKTHVEYATDISVLIEYFAG